MRRSQTALTQMNLMKNGEKQKKYQIILDIMQTVKYASWFFSVDLIQKCLCIDAYVLLVSSILSDFYNNSIRNYFFNSTQAPNKFRKEEKKSFNFPFDFDANATKILSEGHIYFVWNIDCLLHSNTMRRWMRNIYGIYIYIFVIGDKRRRCTSKI